MRDKNAFKNIRYKWQIRWPKEKYRWSRHTFAIYNAERATKNWFRNIKFTNRWPTCVLLKLNNRMNERYTQREDAKCIFNVQVHTGVTDYTSRFMDSSFRSTDLMCSYFWTNRCRCDKEKYFLCIVNGLTYCKFI